MRGCAGAGRRGGEVLDSCGLTGWLVFEVCCDCQAGLWGQRTKLSKYFK